jgi:ribosomal protein L10
MISKKNIYSLEKTTKFFQEYPIILIYQHNNLTVKQRNDLLVQLQQLNKIKILTVKNSIIQRICNSSFFLQSDSSLIKNKQYKKKIEISDNYDNYIEKKKFSNSLQLQHQLGNLLQGPVFLLGCHQIEEFKNTWSILKTSPSFVFLGGQFDNQIYTHLDIQKSLEINNNIYSNFFNIFHQELNFQNNVLSPVLFSILNLKK